METKSIEIDLEVGKAIEAARLSFDESPNAILRRLLDIESNSKVSAPKKGWSYKDVFLPNGTELFMTYNGKRYNGIVRNGLIKVRSGTFKSLSGAASFLTGESLNGWKYWYAILDDSEDGILTDSLRRKRPSRVAR